jgi:translation initiation factor IF-3
LNEKIRAKEVRLIDEEGNQAGVVAIGDAQTMAVQRGLDLLLVSETANPPVCKLVDFGQFKYQLQKKEKLNKKNTKSQVTKELKIGPKISENDYLVKLNKGKEFLQKGFKVKVTVNFRGREVMHMDLGRVILSRYLQDTSSVGTGSDVVSAGRSLVVMVNPK